MLKTLNETLLQRRSWGIFVTLQFLVLEVNSGVVTFANGGHPPFFWLRRREGKVSRRRKAMGLPLGISADAEYREGRLALGPGDLLLFCTDGLLEARGSSPREKPTAEAVWRESCAVVETGGASFWRPS